jgi:hypothetical protein
MFKRVIWMGTGMAVGAAGSFWAKRKVELTVERYLPEQVAERLGANAKDLGRTVRAAASEGRAAMRATEAELRARVEERTFTGPDRPPEPAPSAPVSAKGSKGTKGTKGTSGAGRSGSRRASRVPGAGGSATAARRRARR